MHEGSDAATQVETFIERWQAAGGTERSNFQMFFTELCHLLELPTPDPASEKTRDNAYVFERRVVMSHGDGSTTNGFIDCYRRGCFICEGKKLRLNVATRGFDDALLRARSQAEAYARALPAAEGRPPLLMVVDVGNVIELYAEFSRTGATYTPFPDPSSHRIFLTDLRRPEIRERLRLAWTDALSLDPSRHSARVTREIAVHLAKIAKTLEEAGHGAELVAGFLSRCLFTFFCEDVGLIRKGAFCELLESVKDHPRQFVPLVQELWIAMDHGGFSAAIREDVLHFNGKLFKNPHVIPLTTAQIELLISAAKSDWQYVEPAIFGTLLERALNPTERHALGAHYTPRAYVERLVLPTIIEPLRAEWDDSRTAALALAAEGDAKGAQQVVRTFHTRLCSVRVLDPACGSGNFLYVTLEHLKRLEGEVLNQLAELGYRETLLELHTVSVDPHQFLGLEINPRAAAIAEMVLWIGYLQWHFRSRGHVMPAQPVLRDYPNIECRDALLTYDRIELVRDEKGVPKTRWDGRTFKSHPVTGEQVPDDTARVCMETYVNPQKAVWPVADFIVGNPPFIGASTMRRSLGDGYVDAVRGTWTKVPESADFVMYWWHHAAALTRAGGVQRFGFITTNSLRQTFNRRVVSEHLDATPPLSLAFAIPDHPWVDSTDGAAVRIAMTVGTAGSTPGVLAQVQEEHETDHDEVEVTLQKRTGKLFADLKTGANVAGAKQLKANSLVSQEGVKLHGEGFIVTLNEAIQLGYSTGNIDLVKVIREFRNGRDLSDKPRGLMVVDLFGLSIIEVREKYPQLYQLVLEKVKPERDQNNRKTYRENWWLFGESRRDWRLVSDKLKSYVATVKTSKHRIFQILEKQVLPESKLIAIGLDDSYFLGVLSSKIHIVWGWSTGSWLGIGNDSTYVKSKSFEAFPFPTPSTDLQYQIRDLAEKLDSHRKRQQAQYPDLTLTGMYNVLEKLRSGEALNAKDKIIHSQGLVSVLRELHDELDRAVFSAYGWDDLAAVLVGRPGATTPLPDKPADQAEAEEELLVRLVDLNAKRAREESEGLIRYLRPEYQNPASATAAPRQTEELDLPSEEIEAPESTPPTRAAALPWPKDPASQAKALADLLASSSTPLDLDFIAAAFTSRGKWKARLQPLLDMLVLLGRARESDGKYSGV